MIGVFDTVILVRGLINPYSLCGRLLFDHSAFYDLIVSSDIVVEYVKVINRPALVQKYHEVESRDLPAILEIVAKATMVQPVDTPAVCRDPEDDKFLAAAKAGSAEFIATEDMDLLNLGSYEGIQIVRVEAFLLILETDGKREDDVDSISLISR
jgi:putative PIN family toxin of toxin-antitoxin system